MSKRIEWIDVAKGILIVLVVLGHSAVSGTTEIIVNSFHMAAFFFLAGVTIKFNETIWVFIMKRLKGLIIPYVILAIVFLVYQFTKYKILGGEFNLESGLISIFIPVSGRTSTTVYGLWFLPCLFLTNIAVYGLEHLYRSKKMLAVVAYVIGSVGCIFFYEITKSVSILTILPLAVFWLVCGVFTKNKIENIKKYNIQLAIVMGVLFCVFVGLNYYTTHLHFDLSSMALGVWPLYVLSGLTGSFFIVSISIRLEGIKILSKLGKDSLLYYGLHYEVLGIIDKIVNNGIFQTIITLFILWWVIFLYKKVKIYRKSEW